MTRALVAALAAAVVAWPTAATAASKPFQPDDHYAMQGVSDVRVAPDGAGGA